VNVNLKEIARNLQRELKENRRPGITDENHSDVQALCVAEETGELIGAYRRYTGKARRNGTLEEISDEIADVLITTAGLAEVMNIDLDQAVEAKLKVIYSRGWQESA
jgi:NTP pyrophosphatase (non-canonical NTP hydrolase)